MAYMCKKYGKECDACGECSPDPIYYCPICGEEVYESVFVGNDGAVLGCDNCAHIKDPFEMLENEADE
jgi:uncharacterized OB-fold protein